MKKEKEKKEEKGLVKNATIAAGKATVKYVAKKAATLIAGKSAGALTGGISEVLLNPEEVAPGTRPHFATPEDLS